MAQWILGQIAQLYHLENLWDEAGLDDSQRLARRRRHFTRRLYWLKIVGIRLPQHVLPKSGLGKACTYLLGQWSPLVEHLNHGQTRLDNNLIENAIRHTALGKKNWLFIGHPDAGQRSAIIYSLVVSCLRRGIDPLDYLRDVLGRLPQLCPGADLSALLPCNCKPPVDIELTAVEKS
ncbi:MAG: transposase [Candidatus Synoicihabitans palmerolidicus]|nr:transposase [Candidatus Synoicihabitans palmerolidicus]